MSVELLEYVRSDSRAEVDDGAGVVKNVRVLGLKSANGRTYLREAVARAVGLYEGKAVNANHSPRPGDRSVYDRVGWLANVRQDEGGGLRADLHYLKAHPMAGALVEAARRNPTLFGLSHTARGATSRRGGEDVVEAIESVSSVDLVSEPATVKGLHESKGGGMTLREVCERLKDRPDYVKALREAAQAGVMDYGAGMGDPTAPAAGQSDSDAAIFDAAAAVLRDESMSVSDKLKKIRQLLKIAEGGKGDTDMGATEESRKDAAELAQLRAEKRLRAAAKAAGVEVPDALCESVRHDLTDEQVKALVESCRPQRQPQRPQSAPPPAPQQNGVKESKEAPPEGLRGKELAEWIKNGR